eukprot:GHUV01019781.1.p1 GENE.GHUV01019781.1~~GHUV01019781.1.p1  ORF type:complete len:295 (+),score=54.89 GHUV01019781.1:560-1444(+)
MATPELSNVLLRLGADRHLERERALRSFQQCLRDAGGRPDVLQQLSDVVKSLLTSSKWEQKVGGLMAGKVLVDEANLPDFDNLMVSECLRLLEDSEVRVRLAVGQLLRSLAAKHGVTIIEQCQERILSSVNDHFDREGEGSRADSAFSSGIITPSGAGGMPSQPGSPGSTNLLAALLQTSYQPLVPGVGQLRHGTEGWKCLETSMKAFQQLVEGTGAAVAPYITGDVQDLLYRSMHHPNRFVRETAHFTAASMCEALAGPQLLEIGQDLAERLADGLSDNWSQVRLLLTSQLKW